MIKEICIENGTRITELIEKHVQRVELCDNLAVGGTTVSYGVAKNVIERCHKHNIEVMAIVRCRGGNFVYNNNEMAMMLEDIKILKQLGVDGVVFGSIGQDFKLDSNQTLAFIDASQGLKKTFHMAFDHLLLEEQFKAIDFLVQHGVDRILTHGNSQSSLIEDNIEHLKALIKYADGRIIILPGGGVTSENVDALAKTLNVGEFHGTRLV